MIYKKNKKKVASRDIKIFKEIYFLKWSIKDKCNELWYNLHSIRKWLEGPTTTYIEYNNIKLKRYSICEVYKKLDEYFIHSIRKWVEYLNPKCKYCNNLMWRNKSKINRNTFTPAQKLKQKIYWRIKGISRRFRIKILKICELN